MRDNRPNADDILQKIKQELHQEPDGKLKIFLGAAAGVGKTYAMLKASVELENDGVDVVIGYIETHGRVETIAELPSNIETIPLKSFNYKGKAVKEFDIDAALERKPDVLILDELAHTNADGSRNHKRYQDVLELLNAGITVYTALNIQHIESLNNIVEQITGVEVAETVPDSIIEEADEIVLIDLPTEELLQRLKDGKIYAKGVVETALSNFFRKGNLIALRELALRRTAQKVDQEGLEYRDEKNIEVLWDSSDKLLLFIEPGYSTEKMIRSAKNVYEKGFSAWVIVYLDNEKFADKSLVEQQKFFGLLDLGKKLGASVEKLIGADPASAVTDFMLEHNINTIMLGQSRQPLYYKLFGKTLAEKISDLMPEVHINLVTEEPKSQEAANRHITNHKNPINYIRILKDIIAYGSFYTLLSIILMPFYHIIHNENILMIYLLVTLLISRKKSTRTSLVASMLSTMSYDIFFVEPRFSLAISDWQYSITFIAMSIICILFSLTHGNMKFQLKQLNQIRRQREYLYELSKQFASAMVIKQIIDVVPQYFTKIFSADYMLFLPSQNEDLEFAGGVKFANANITIVQWVFANERRAGLETDTFSSSEYLYLPIMSPTRIRGVAIFKPTKVNKFFSVSEQETLHDFQYLLAITLERVHFGMVALETELRIANNRTDKKI